MVRKPVERTYEGYGESCYILLTWGNEHSLSIVQEEVGERLTK